MDVNQHDMSHKEKALLHELIENYRHMIEGLERDKKSLQNDKSLLVGRIQGLIQDNDELKKLKEPWLGEERRSPSRPPAAGAG